MIQLQSYVQGRWQAGAGKPQILVDPASEEPLATLGSEGIDFRAALAHGRERGGAALRALTFAERAGLLAQLAKALHAQRDELLDLESANAGATRSDGKFDVDGAIGTLSAYAGLGAGLGARRFLVDGPGVQLGRTARWWGEHVRVPRTGIALHVNAFNFPAWNMAEKMACALLAGMPVLEKPGTPTALVAWRMAQIWVEARILPEGAFQFVAGSLGAALDHVGPQDVLAFTGSSATGALLRSQPAVVRHNVHVNIEADSINAAVLGPDVGPESETWSLLLANVETDVTQKAGQKCTAVRRVFVPRARLDELAAELVARLARVKVGDPKSQETRMGPLASRAQLDDVRAGIRRLAAQARSLCGGPDPVHAKGFFVAPTLFAATDPEALVLHAFEVFGPVATLVPYDGSPAEAVRLVNRGGGGLVASLYSNERAWIEEVALGIAPWHGRVWIGSDKAADQALAPGMVLPLSLHGGPGRAGGGAELGGLRGLEPYMQRVAVQGFQGLVASAFGAS
jgi:oxepin-CoA hydrolase/3-oxo-5,6-dehydrosuberyl-CoA semialdehyde dehydrogenase